MPFIYKLIYTFIAQTYLKQTFEEKKSDPLSIYNICFYRMVWFRQHTKKKTNEKRIKVWVSRYFGVEGSDLFSSTCGFYIWICTVDIMWLYNCFFRFLFLKVTFWNNAWFSCMIMHDFWTYLSWPAVMVIGLYWNQWSFACPAFVYGIKLSPFNYDMKCFLQ